MATIATPSADQRVNCILLRANGPSFCVGYDYYGAELPAQFIDDWWVLRDTPKAPAPSQPGIAAKG